MFIQVLSALLLLLPLSDQSSDNSKGKNRQATIDKELATLATDLDKLDKGKVAERIYSFAYQHLPLNDKVAILVSTDKKICVAIGEAGTEKSPKGADVEFTPTGTQYNIVVGGKGYDSKSDVGGDGGSAFLKAKSLGKCILLGGEGGRGADLKPPATDLKGGTGGGAWFGENLKAEDFAFGGKGGYPGGDGGSAGPKPPTK